MLKRQFKNPYYHLHLDLLEEGFFDDISRAKTKIVTDISDIPGKIYDKGSIDSQKLYNDFKSDVGAKSKPITSRLYNRKVGLSALAGAGLVAGGIAAYNHFTDNDVPLAMPSIGGGVLGGITGALHLSLIHI